MYNRYIDGSGRVVPESTEPFRVGSGGRQGTGQTWFHRLGESLGLLGGEAKNAGAAGILKGFGLEDLDSGDILLMLILLLIFLEGDHTELVITLGLMLLLGGEEDQKE